MVIIDLFCFFFLTFFFNFVSEIKGNYYYYHG